MNVNAAASGVLVPRFDALQPQNSRNNGIATSCVLGDNFAPEASSLEDGSLWKVITQLYAHAEPAQRRLVAAESIPDSEL